MSTILIVDPTPYREELRSAYLSDSYSVETCDDALDAIAKLGSDDISLVIADIDLPGDNSFEFYYYLKKNYPFLPVIMLTARDIDEFFDRVFTEGIGNVLHKPVAAKEILTLSRKLITRENIFGLKNHIENIRTAKKISINKSTQIMPAIKVIGEHMSAWGFEIENVTMLNLILNEMIINAVYHAHGLTEQKLRREAVTLEEGKFVEIGFGCSTSQLGISVTDFNGKLTQSRILESMNNVVVQKKLLDEAFEKGLDITDLISETGRGLDLVRQIATEYYFIIERNKRTEIILLFDRNANLNGNACASLKIIEKE